VNSAPPLRVGSRGSQLALWQANAVVERIAATGGPPCRILTIKTTGDRLAEAPLSEAGGKQLFVKEIEEALLGNEIDLAVHSTKDLPAVLPAGLAIEAALPREDPHDAIVLPAGTLLETGAGSDAALMEGLARRLGASPSIGTSSVRRIAQLAQVLPAGARFKAIRGNLDTRLRKLDAGEYDALVLAAAGLKRLGLGARISAILPATLCVPAPGQGIVAVETREDDDIVRAVVSKIDDDWARTALDAERSAVEALGAGCQTPVGAFASPAGTDGIDFVVVVMSLDGQRSIRASARGPRSDAKGLGARVAAHLIARGAREILSEAERARP